MSRTFRRRNYEIIYPEIHGRSVAGFYTKWYYDLEEGHCFRAPTRKEFFKKYWSVHGDHYHYSCGNGCSCRLGYFGKKTANDANRTFNKRQLHKWIKNPSYDPIFNKKPIEYDWL
jgi:hypothetical protein